MFSRFVVPVYAGISNSVNNIRFDGMSDEILLPAIVAAPILIIYRKLLNFYLKLFHSLNMKISRSKEERADISAVLTCGTLSFANGLKKCVIIGDVI